MRAPDSHSLPAHPLLRTERPVAIAHRGGSALRPENTMAAFEHAAALGADGFELDVHVSRDGHVVVCHDATVDRTTNGSGAIAAMDAAVLGALDAGWAFGAAAGFPFRGQGIGIPRFADVLTRFPAVGLIVELKGTNPAVARAAVRTAREHGAIGRVCFGGFSDAVVAAARAEGEDVITSAATGDIRWALWRSKVGLTPRTPAYRAFQVPERYGATRVVSRRFVGVMRRAGLVVHVWTVNEPDDMRRLLGWGVHGLITDHPDRAADVVRTWRQAPTG